MTCVCGGWGAGNSGEKGKVPLSQVPGSVVKNLQEMRFEPWVERSPWGRKQQPILGFLPGKSHGQGSLEGCSPWGHKESDAI